MEGAKVVGRRVKLYGWILKGSGECMRRRERVGQPILWHTER